MNRHISKILSILLMIGLNWTGLSAIGDTLAYFNDIEGARENTLSAGTLDFSLNNKDFDKFIGLDETILLSSVLTNSGSLDFQYTVEAEKISGSDDFCKGLLLEAKLNGVKKHDDGLMLFSVGTSTARGTWKFEIEMPVSATNIPHGDVCEIDLVFKGWQTDVANYGGGGFFDEERIRIRLTSKMVVLNEFLPNPEGYEYGFDFGDDNNDMPKGEWVELYNNSDFDFDLAGWYIKYSLDTDTNKIMITNANTAPAGTIIGTKNWLVVYMNKAVLNNTGDTIKLFNNANRLIDSYAYTTNSDYCDIEPTPGDENTTDTFGDCSGVPPNKSYARIPDGIGDWVDPVPTPGGMNILEGENIYIAPSAAQIAEPIIDESVETLTQDIDAIEIEEEVTITEEIVAPEEIAEELATEEKIINEEENVEAEKLAIVGEEQVAGEEISLAEIPAVIEEPVDNPLDNQAGEEPSAEEPTEENNE